VSFLPTGTHNAITDVPGVRVGHQTVWKGDYSPSPTQSGISPPPLAGEGQGGGPVLRTGVTATGPIRAISSVNAYMPA
jgi:L-aminopeptidase/D-esterase-like protein